MTKEQNRRDFVKLCTTMASGLSLSCICLTHCSKSQQDKSDKKEQPSTETDFNDLGYCGYNCKKECKVYLATINNDYQVKTNIAKQQSQKFGKEIKPENVNCDGCRSERVSYFAENICTVRECAIEKNVLTCAHCDDLPSCDNELWSKWPKLRKHIDDIRKELNQS